MTSKSVRGKDAEVILDQIGISVSRSTIPNDPNPPLNPSGVRLGTPAITTRGMGEEEIQRIATWIDAAITKKDEPEILRKIREDVKSLCNDFPIPSI